MCSRTKAASVGGHAVFPGLAGLGHQRQLRELGDEIRVGEPAAEQARIQVHLLDGMLGAHETVRNARGMAQQVLQRDGACQRRALQPHAQGGQFGQVLLHRLDDGQPALLGQLAAPRHQGHGARDLSLVHAALQPGRQAGQARAAQAHGFRGVGPGQAGDVQAVGRGGHGVSSGVGRLFRQMGRRAVGCGTAAANRLAGRR
jgi:hypothetical protein